ncbi:MAG: hypothetical protein ACKV0T_31800 [Planctomycetales bacterium]
MSRNHRNVENCQWLPTALVLSMLALSSHDVRSADEKPATKTKSVAAGDLKLQLPESWKANPQVRDPRIFECVVPPAAEDKEPGEFVVFYFGQGGAGGVQANIQRWVGQFEEEGRKVKTFTGMSEQGKYTLVDLSGSYNKSVGPPIAKKSKRLPGWRVINVFIETESGPYFLKIDGPAKTIASIENDLRVAFGGNKESEKELKGE